MQQGPPRRDIRKQIPNALVWLRLALACVFFAILSRIVAGESGPAPLYWAIVLFAIAALTDAVDGWLARRLDAITLFGRVMDPFADKILVLGAFVMLAGPSFSVVSEAGRAQVSGLAPWMAVVVLARELLVTSLRGIVEARGGDFSAIGAGKIKMAAQSVAVPGMLLCVALWSQGVGGRGPAIAAAVLGWGVTLLTAWSAIPYIRKASRALTPPPPETEPLP